MPHLPPDPGGGPLPAARLPVARRRVLAALAGGAALAGCSPEDRAGDGRRPAARPGSSVATGAGTSAADPQPTTPEPLEPGPTEPGDPGALVRAAAAESTLLAAYDATLRRHPALAGRLRPVRVEHAAHLAALRRAGAAAPAPAARSAAVAGSAAAALRALVRAEQAAAAARVADCVAAPRAAAPLLASIGAAEVAHVPALAAR